MANIQVLETEKWSLGYDRNSHGSVLKFDFSDRDPVLLFVQHENALAIARAILDQYENPPTNPNRLS